MQTETWSTCSKICKKEQVLEQKNLEYEVAKCKMQECENEIDEINQMWKRWR